MPRQVSKFSEYQQRYHLSIEQPETFWAQAADTYLHWQKKWNTVITGSLEQGNFRWFSGAKLNACENCLDRHLPHKKDQVAFYCEGNNPGERQVLTYQNLFDATCQFANGLKHLGLKQGDKVCLYMPMIPEMVIALLACCRLGLVHSVVFAGFSSEALKNRIADLNCQCVITADASGRGQKITPLKQKVDEAIEMLEVPCISNVVVVKRLNTEIAWHASRDHWYHEVISDQAKTCAPVYTQAEDPLFVLYTSGSTGKPKGVVHATAGYLLYAAITFSEVFDYRDNDVYYCTADCGWITGHSYLIYGPLLNGATSVLYEGVPDFPDASRLWQIVDQYRVTIFYTAPTLIRGLMQAGDGYVTQCQRDSLRILGTVGEPINPESWHWYHTVVGQQKCEIIDTWWQTETGGIAIAPIPSLVPEKPGCAQFPFYGIQPVWVDEQGKISDKPGEGSLLLKGLWPGMMQTLYNDAQRFHSAYLEAYPGYYLTGDGGKIDEDGQIWITGRIDDVINVSGHRIGTAEVEAALTQHSDITESAVVGIQHAIKGQCLIAFVHHRTESQQNADVLRKDLKQLVRKILGGYAIPEQIYLVKELPKTRSGKIMRRLLRKISSHDIEQLGDTSTLLNPNIIDDLQQVVDTQEQNHLSE